MKKVFISVNYGTADLIEGWIDSVLSLSDDSNVEFIVVDNFHSNEERQRVTKLADSKPFSLIESENVGYGQGLNIGIKAAKKLHAENFFVLAGNLDLNYYSLGTIDDTLSNIVLVPIVKEGSRNRNPFLTSAQRFAIPLYWLAAKLNSSFLYFIAVLVNKVIGYLPSPIWAVHGSLFCFTSDLIEKEECIFNSQSFLYGEELEFASFVHNKNFKIELSSITVSHQSHAATADIVRSRTKFMNIWCNSFLNWYKRWKR